MDFGTSGADRNCMKVRLSAKLYLRKTREKHKVLMSNIVQKSFMIFVLSVWKTFILLTQRWTRWRKACCIAIETALKSAYWSYWKHFCKLNASTRWRGERFLSILKRIFRTYGLYSVEVIDFGFRLAHAKKGSLKAIIHKDINAEYLLNCKLIRLYRG